MGKERQQGAPGAPTGASLGLIGALLGRPCAPKTFRKSRQLPQDAQKARQGSQNGRIFAKNWTINQNRKILKNYWFYKVCELPGHTKNVCEAVDAAETRPATTFQRRRCTQMRFLKRSRQARAAEKARKQPKTAPRSGEGASEGPGGLARNPPVLPAFSDHYARGLLD